MHIDLTSIVIVLGTVVAISCCLQLILLRRLGKLASARRDGSATEIQDLATAISQMLDEVTQLSATIAQRIGSERNADPGRARQTDVTAVYGPHGARKAAPRMAVERAEEEIPARAAGQTLDALLGATDRVVDKLEIAKQAGVGVGEVELWLRRHGDRSNASLQTAIKVGA